MSKAFDTIDVLDRTYFNKLRDNLIPACGKSDIVAGEIIRAMDRIIYRFWNDGDRVGIGYGNETCNSSYRYLSRMLGNDCPYLNRAYSDEQYEELLLTLAQNVKKFIENNPESLTEKNFEDSRTRDPELDVDDSWVEEEEDDEEFYNEEDEY